MRIASWNVEGRLSSTKATGRGVPLKIVDSILLLDADVVFLAEAYKGMMDATAQKRLTQFGYKIYEVSYDEQQRDLHSAVATHSVYISRVSYVAQKTIRLGDRSMPVVSVKESTNGQILQLVGVHLDDRSEWQRLEQVEALIRWIDVSVPVVLMGDFNAMHAAGISRVLAKPVVGMMMQRLPGVMGGIGRRVHEMAFGETMEVLVKGLLLHDADPRHRATATPKMIGFEWLPSIRLLAIDHILATAVLQMSDYRIAADGGSDHRAISVNIKLD